MIEVSHLSMRLGAFALRDVSLRIAPGAYGIVMGPTGSGKTSLAECLCGLRQPQAGVVRLMGEDVTHAKPAARGIGYVPQDGALFNSMTVGEHLAFALRIRNWRRQAITARVNSLAERLGLADLLARRPHRLSGGERQRVALGRALAASPPVLCLDEPLSALDHESQITLCALLAEVQREHGLTVLHITHNPYEAARLGEVFFQLRDGALTQAERPPLHDDDA